MTGDCHVRFRENAGVKLPCVTRLGFIAGRKNRLSANFILTSPACPDAHLHMIIYGFVLKFTKPAHKHHLQVFQCSQAWVLLFTGTLRQRNLTTSRGFIP
jgi:hypothetical protein